MPTDIYDQHDAAFRDVSAFVVCKDGERVATVAFKHSRTGTRLTCYLHITGAPMVKGWADGGGYDKHTSAVEHGCRMCPIGDGPNMCRGGIMNALADRGHVDGWASWDHRLRDAGYDVWQAV